MPSLRDAWAALLVGFVLLVGSLALTIQFHSVRHRPSCCCGVQCRRVAALVSSSAEERRLTRHQPDLATPRWCAADFARVGCSFGHVRSKTAKPLMQLLAGIC
jgi:hypothetical protein